MHKYMYKNALLVLAFIHLKPLCLVRYSNGSAEEETTVDDISISRVYLMADQRSKNNK